jgi:CRP/FNR family cyclic AMP-dependent transcriptional regulator
MQPHFAELVGIAAAAASLYAAHSKTIIPLRAAALAANCLAMAYSFLHGTYPTFALNLILLPMNAWRLRDMLNLIRDVDRAVKSDMNADWLLPYMRPKNFKAGEAIIRRANMPPPRSTSSRGKSRFPTKTKRWEKEHCLARSDSSHPTDGAP